MIFGIVAMILEGISWIVWGYVAGIAPRRNLNIGVMVCLSAFIAVMVCLFASIIAYLLGSTGIGMPSVLKPAMPEFTDKNSLLILGLVIFGGISNFFQLQFMSRAMKNGPNGIIWSIVQAGFIVPFAVGIIFFGEKATWTFILAVAMVIVALIMFAVSADNRSKGNWLMFTIFSFLSTCICQSMQYIPSNLEGVEMVSSVWRTLGCFLGMFLGFFITCIFSRDLWFDAKRMIRNKYTWRYALLIDIVVVFCTVAFLYPGMDALADSSVGAIATQLMTASGIVAFEVYALVGLKEKRKPIQVVALLLCLASIVAVCF